MSSVLLSDASVHFPVFNSVSRGLINTIFRYKKNELNRIQASLGAAPVVMALNKINLFIEEGDKIGLLGRNGAGKSTLLRVLAGIYEPTDGSVFIQGDVSSLTDIMLGMDPDSSGAENVSLRASILGLNKKRLDVLTEDVYKFTELGEHFFFPIRTYSTGMLLRLAFAVSTAIRPDILVMDEMIGAGDLHFRERARERLLSMLAEVKILILASHDVSIIRQFCNRAIILDAGRIVADGDVDSVVARYISGAY
jgi:ABC-type polysaccharide/polyol phosphate transport system ATPase subunit